VSLEDFVNRESEGVIHQIINEEGHVFIEDSEVWVRVHFNQPYSEVFINKEVEAHQFEAVLPIVGVEIVHSSQIAVYDEVFDPQDWVREPNIQWWEGQVQVPLELVEGELVALLELFVIVRMLLIAVVGQMHKFVLVVKRVGVGTCPHVTILVKVELILMCS